MRQVRHLAVALVCMASGTAVWADDAAATLLRTSLVERNKAIQTFSADVAVTVSPGRGVLKYVEAQSKLAAFGRRTNNPKAPDEQESTEAAQGYRGFASRRPVATRYRYFMLLPDKLRYELWSANSAKGSPPPAQDPVVECSIGGPWKTLFPASRSTETTPQAQFAISGTPQHAGPWLEDVRGAALVNCYLTNDGLEPGPFPFVRWGELLPLLDLDGARVEKKPLPGEKEPMDYVEVGTHEVEWRGFPEIHRAHYRFLMWFDPQNGLTLRRLEMRELQVTDNGETYELPGDTYAWRDPQQTADGITFFSRCEHAGVTCVLDSRDAVPAKADAFRMEAFEMTRELAEFSNVRINQPLADDLFDLQPPVGANVIDEVKGERYVVGSAGEALERTALELRDAFDPRLTAPARPWRWVIVAAIAVGLAGGAWMLVQRRAIRMR